MTTKEARRALKAELKELASNIRTHRQAFRLAQSSNTETWEQLKQLEREKFEYRHKHIVRCLLRGRTRDQIERPKGDNKPDESFIKGLLEKYTEATKAA